MANPENKQIPYESTQKDIRDAIESVATAIGGIAVPSADHVSYDNSVSGLSATDVQNALDEIVSDIPTVNNGTLTIQQNGTSIGSFSANTASNVTANIKTPTADKKTATDQFNTADGGLLSKCQINLVPVQSGSGDPSPDNVRPISGHTEVDLYNVGKNRFDYSSISLGYISASDGSWNVSKANATSDYIPVHSGQSITISANTSCANMAICTFDSDKTFIEKKQDLNITSKTISIANDGYVRCSINYDNIVHEMVDWRTILANIQAQIEKGSVATTFEPYLGHLYTVQIGSTVYGGYVDLVSGEMTVDRVYCKLADQTLVRRGTNTSGIYRYAFAPSPAVQIGRYVNVISNALVNKDAYASYERTAENCITPDANGNYINMYASDKQTDTAWITFATNNDVEIVYPLATPQTIQLTPQQIEALVGQNNLSTPLSGQSIETNGVEYKELFTFADVKEYVDKKIPDAPTTDGTYTLQAVVSGGVPTYSWI